MDTLSADGGLVEHDPTRPENNFGPSDYDRTHRLTASFMVEIPGLGAQGSLLGAVTRHWSMAGLVTYQSGTPFSVIGAPTRNAWFAQVSRPRVSFAPGATSPTPSGRAACRIASTATST